MDKPLLYTVSMTIVGFTLGVLGVLDIISGFRITSALITFGGVLLATASVYNIASRDYKNMEVTTFSAVMSMIAALLLLTSLVTSIIF